MATHLSWVRRDFSFRVLTHPLKPMSVFLDGQSQVPVLDSSGRRATAVDALRGLVMVLMPLDHTREFFTNYAGNPLDPLHAICKAALQCKIEEI